MMLTNATLLPTFVNDNKTVIIIEAMLPPKFQAFQAGFSAICLRRIASAEVPCSEGFCVED
jgi:hypothetical protein